MSEKCYIIKLVYVLIRPCIFKQHFHLMQTFNSFSCFNAFRFQAVGTASIWIFSLHEQWSMKFSSSHEALLKLLSSFHLLLSTSTILAIYALVAWLWEMARSCCPRWSSMEVSCSLLTKTKWLVFNIKLYKKKNQNNTQIQSMHFAEKLKFNSLKRFFHRCSASLATSFKSANLSCSSFLSFTLLLTKKFHFYNK